MPNTFENSSKIAPPCPSPPVQVGRPLAAVARLVALYHWRELDCRLWATTVVSDDRTTPIITEHHARLRTAIDLAQSANGQTGAPVAPTAAVIYLLIESGCNIDDITRFLVPADAPTEPGDPRMCLRRTIITLNGLPIAAPSYRYMAFTLKAWQNWVSGHEVRVLAWKEDDGMPRIAQWVADIPTP